MSDSFHSAGHSAQEVEQIKQGLLALGGISMDDLTADGLAAIADTGHTVAEISANSLTAGQSLRITSRGVYSDTITPATHPEEVDDAR